jgi:hypothetical protein
LSPKCTAKQGRNALFPYIPSSCTIRGFQLVDTALDTSPFYVGLKILQNGGVNWKKNKIYTTLEKKKTELKIF